MSEWYQVLSGLLTNELRLFFGLLLLTKLLNVSLPRNTWILAVLGEAAVTIFGAAYVPAAGLIAAEILLVAAVSWYSLRERLRICLFLIFFYEIGVALWEFLFSAAFGILFRSAAFLDAGAPEFLAGVWLTRLFLAALAFLLAKRWNPGNPQAFRLVSILAMLGLFGTVTLSEQTILPIGDDRTGAWIILSMLLLLAILFYRMGRQRDMEAEIARLKEEQAEILERDYQTLSRTYSANAKLYHDLHNHIEAIYQTLKQGEVEAALQYCEDLRTPMKEIAETVWTGDRAVDYLISSKVALAEQRQVRTKVNIEFPRNTNIRNVDLTTILGNLLDNAVEAAGTAPEHMRFLNLTIRRINDMLIIKVENGCGHAPVQEEGRLLTSKKDASMHGFGLKSVRTAVERYDGSVDTDYAGGVFRSVATLSFYPVKRI